jgi:hypothetical protein
MARPRTHENDWRLHKGFETGASIDVLSVFGGVETGQKYTTGR